MKAKKKIHAFDFSGEGAHVALVGKAANLQTVLTMKANEQEVTVTTSMRNFLSKFFGMWSDDAAVLAGVLGYSDGTDPDNGYDSYIKDKIESVQLLKGLDEIPKSLPKSIALKVEELNKKFGDKVTSEGSPLGANNLKGDSNLSEVKIDAKELDILKAAAQRVADLEKSAAEVEVLKAEAAATKELIETLKSQAAAKEKAELVSVIKGYSFVTEDSREALAEFILKSEGSDVVLTALEKARDAITAAASIEGEQGTDAAGDLAESDVEKSKVVNRVSEILKSRKS